MTRPVKSRWLRRCAAAWLVFAGGLPALPAARAAGALSAERQREVVRESLNNFDEAVSLARTDPQAAERLYRRSAAGFEALHAAGVTNAALEYNLGNTYFRLHQLGPAVLHYRRAARLSPSDAHIAANLGYARERVEPLIQAGQQRELVRRVFFWHYAYTITTRYRLALAAGLLGWFGLALWLRKRARPLLVLSIAVIVIGLTGIGSALWQIRAESNTPAAVIVDKAQILRLGRGEGYDPALAEPLGPGVELRILQQRGEWVEIELANGETGWLPAAGVERV